MNDCLFCKIVTREVPATIRYETDEVLAFDDIHPKAETHILVIPKHHVSRLSQASDAELPALVPLWAAVRDIAKELNLDGYHVSMNNGEKYGQTVPHLHLHLLSGQGIKTMV